MQLVVVVVLKMELLLLAAHNQEVEEVVFGMVLFLIHGTDVLDMVTLENLVAVEAATGVVVVVLTVQASLALVQVDHRLSQVMPDVHHLVMEAQPILSPQQQ